MLDQAIEKERPHRRQSAGRAGGHEQPQKGAASDRGQVCDPALHANIIERPEDDA